MFLGSTIFWEGGIRVVTVDTVTPVQILNEIVCISHIANTPGKGMIPLILIPSMGK